MDAFPYSARFAVLDDALRQAVLAARQVARCFRDSRTLESLFVAVLEETPSPGTSIECPDLWRYLGPETLVKCRRCRFVA